MREGDVQRKLSRRSFLTGTAITAGTVALAGLAGCSPQQTTGSSGTSNGGTGGASPADVAGAQPHQTLNPSEARWPVLEELQIKAAGEGNVAFVAEAIPEGDIIATHEVDVVVCGLGPAGDAAALSCAERGLSVVAVEKQPKGNYNSATIGGFDSKIHKHWGMSYDLDAWISDAMVDCAFQGEMDLYRNYIRESGEAVDWYLGHFDNQDPNDYPLTFAAGDFPDFRDEWDKTSLSRSWNTSLNLPYPAGDLADILAGMLGAAGVEIRYNTPAVQLVKDDSGKVCGVIVEGEDGYERYDCAKGVVLATGGYEFNEQMLAERVRPRNCPSHWLTKASGNTGDGHQMALAVGAAEDDYPHAVMLDPEQLMPYVRVNRLGKRFAPEYEPYGHLALAIQQQPQAYDFYIVDSAIDDKIDKIWTPSSSCYGPKEVWIGAAKSENALVADSFEELAELMDVPSDALIETIGRWNEMAAAGKDDDYNFPGDMMMTLDTPPYYATKEYADGLCTGGGLLVNTDCQVLDADRAVVEGLYAVGIVSGGMFYNTYPHNLNCLSHTRNCMMGYKVGKVLGA